MSPEPDSEPAKRRWDPKQWVAPVLISALVGATSLATWLGIPSCGQLYTKAEAAEHQRKSDEVHEKLDARVKTVEDGLGNKLKSFEDLLKERLPKPKR